MEEAIRRLAAAFESGRAPAGAGLKKLRFGLWEARAGLQDRIVFAWEDDLVEFLVVGTHDDVRRFLRKQAG